MLNPSDILAALVSDLQSVPALCPPSTSAKITGTIPGPFTITTGVNDMMLIGIDGSTPQTITLDEGTFTTDQIAGKMNADIGFFDDYMHINAVHVNSDETLQINSPITGYASEVNLVDVANSAYSTLGLTVQDLHGSSHQNVNIVAYSDMNPNYRSLEECINSQIGNVIIVAWVGTDIGYRGSSPRWQHKFKLIFLGPGLNDESPYDPGYLTLLTGLINSVPSGSQRWIERTILSNLDPPDVTEIRPVKGESSTHVEVSFHLLEIFG